MERLVLFTVIIYKCKKFNITEDESLHEIKILYKDTSPIIKLKHPILEKVHKRNRIPETIHKSLGDIKKMQL